MHATLRSVIALNRAPECETLSPIAALEVEPMGLGSLTRYRDSGRGDIISCQGGIASGKAHDGLPVFGAVHRKRFRRGGWNRRGS